MSGIAIQNEWSQIAALPETRASFGGLVRGQLRKIAGLRIFWAIVALMVLMVAFAQLLLVTGPNAAHQLQAAPMNAYVNVVSGDMAIVRILSGILALILAAHVVGLEYQQGTIRNLLGRGVGRLQLLGAQALALLVVIVAFMAALLLIELAFTWVMSIALAGGSQPWSALNGEFWGDIWGFLLYLLINAVVTLLLGIAASVLGRSLAFGLTVGIGFFAVDNVAAQVLRLLGQITDNDFWRYVSGALLGPLLNRLPDYTLAPIHTVVQTAHGPATVTYAMSGFGGLPLIWVGAGHALLNIGLWSLLFIVVAVTLTVRRDVLD
jgi:ABC-type transport system involved in multi-copper enzyme maturation permease subunit